MRRGQIIAIGLAAVCGVGAMLMANTFLKAPPKAAKVANEVLVAKSNIGVGETTSISHFEWKELPSGNAGDGSITRKARPQAMREFAGSIARSRVLAGETISESKFIRSGSGGILAAILKPGMRAYSTKISEVTAAGRLILPNDRVDVILIRKRRGDERTPDTLFSNVRVMAVGQVIDGKEKKNAAGATATLELTPRQAEILALANTMGDISLSLRSVADANEAPNSDGDPDKYTLRILRYGVSSRQYGVD